MTNAEREAMKLPEEQRDVFWQGYIACVKEFESTMCMQRTNTDCPYLAAKVAERMKALKK